MNSTPITFTHCGEMELNSGLDLLMSAFVLHHCARPQDRLLIVGGDHGGKSMCLDKRDYFGLVNAVELIDPSPFKGLKPVFDETDVFVSPLTKGPRAPKILFSYLASGLPVLATGIPAHTDILHGDVALLTKPEPAHFARGMLSMAEQPTLRERLGRSGRALVCDKYSREACQRSLDEIYSYVEQSMRQAWRL